MVDATTNKWAEWRWQSWVNEEMLITVMRCSWWLHPTSCTPADNQTHMHACMRSARTQTHTHRRKGARSASETLWKGSSIKPCDSPISHHSNTENSLIAYHRIHLVIIIYILIYSCSQIFVFARKPRFAKALWARELGGCSVVTLPLCRIEYII